jgi:DNA polymerase IV
MNGCDMAQRWIFHVDMDAFFVSVEEIFDPGLKGKPVIVGGDPDGRSVVAAASYEARKYGIHSAMPLSQAKRLCPKAIFIHGRHGAYGEFSRRVFNVLAKYTPDIERTSVDEGYLDMTGFERMYGHPLSVADKMKREIKERTGLNASFGISSNKLISKIASDCAKPNGILLVMPGYEREFLAPLDIKRLPGVGKVMQEKLHLLGIKTVGDIAQINKDVLESTFGKWGLDLYYSANGISNSPVEESGTVKSISRETTFETDTLEMAFIDATLFHLIEDVAHSLRAEQLQARCITLKLRYSDFKTVTRSVTLKEPTDLDKVIYENIKSLWKKAYTRRGRVRLVGAGVSNFTSAVSQPDLFEGEKMRKLKNYYRSIDKIRAKYGDDAVRIVKSE